MVQFIINKYKYSDTIPGKILALHANMQEDRFVILRVV